MSPTVSVVIPTYNAARFIEQTISSVLVQTMGDLEVIVVDDGSSDATCDIVARMEPRVRLIRQSRGGVCVARNRGLEAARAPYVCFLDHDDFWHPRKLEVQLRWFDADPEVALVHTESLWWYEDAQGRIDPPETVFEASPSTELIVEESGWVYHHLLVGSFLLTSAALLRTTAVREVGGFDPTLPYSEDWDLWLRLSRRWRMLKIRGHFVLYRQLPTQGSRKFREVDYRTQLLERAVATWGLAGPDGSTHGERVVWHQIADFHAGYGLDCLRSGAVALARRSFWRAWRCHPMRWRYLAYLGASQLGWRPNW